MLLIFPGRSNVFHRLKETNFMKKVTSHLSLLRNFDKQEQTGKKCKDGGKYDYYEDEAKSH